jgi:hypothetical protein
VPATSDVVPNLDASTANPSLGNHIPKKTNLLKYKLVFSNLIILLVLPESLDRESQKILMLCLGR